MEDMSTSVLQLMTMTMQLLQYMLSSIYQVFLRVHFCNDKLSCASLLDIMDVESVSFVRFSINDSVNATAGFSDYLNSVVRYGHLYGVECLLCCLCIGSVFD